MQLVDSKVIFTNVLKTGKKNATVSRFYCPVKTMKKALPAVQMSPFPLPAVCRSLYGGSWP